MTPLRPRPEPPLGNCSPPDTASPHVPLLIVAALALAIVALAGVHIVREAMVLSPAEDRIADPFPKNQARWRDATGNIVRPSE